MLQEKKTVKSLRMETGMNQRQFADFFEINLRTLQGWEHGKQPPEGVVSMMERILCAEWNPKDSK